jgi:putative FmdB family regulatory protein
VPIYDYLCTNCRHLTEVIHGINDAGPRFCPACGAEGTMRKALSTPAVHFKGSGWAKKDRSSASATRTKAAASSSSGDGSSADGASTGGSASSESSTPAKESAKPVTEKPARSED